jgi:AcrR family transcriptional regulator
VSAQPANGRRGPGRPPGSRNTREEILDAARTEFASAGYDATTVRGIARRAGVDPALIHHYFGSKDKVFVAALQFPIDPVEIAPKVFAGGPDGVGERLLRFLLGVFEAPDTRPRALALVRSAVSNDEVAALFRGFIVAKVIIPNVASLGVSDPDVRASCAVSQIGGLLLARYIVGVEPLASAPPEDVLRWIAPTLQRYLAGDLDGR